MSVTNFATKGYKSVPTDARVEIPYALEGIEDFLLYATASNSVQNA